MTSRGESYEEVIGMRKIGYLVDLYQSDNKVMSKSMKQRKTVDSGKQKSRQNQQDNEKQWTLIGECSNGINKNMKKGGLQKEKVSTG